ncbi:ATP-binding protein [Rhodococcus qingshengii]|uniref:ATP-binding protein n=1 Tax=Rhodococcus qingshengii TaxID=334542 RepID=UPI0021B13D44|nr:FtsK/SpoIIIE domain-containing protein [Rhodococcus qingshengii]MCT6735283.1 hypothetical protein [Rhodococcus qingshengii]
MRENTAMKKKARAYAKETGEKYVTAQKHIAAQVPEPTAAQFPAIVTLPIPTRIPTNIDEANDMYPGFRMQLGIDESGDIVGVDLTKNPHAVFFGEPGSGKSVLARTVIESFRTAGWMIFIGDSDGTDYRELQQQPGICAISQRAAEHVRMVRMVADELRARQADVSARMKAGEGGLFQYPPLLLVLDDFARICANVRAEYGAVPREFDADLLRIGRTGREFKVHLIVTSQYLSRYAFPAGLLDNLSTRVSIGPSDSLSLFSAFPEAHRNEAAQIIQSIGKRDRGRGLVTFVDDDGDSRITEFQAFLGYTPGALNGAPGSEIEIALAKYKREASEQIPSLYPRFWFQVDGPQYGQSLADLYACPMVALDRPDGTPDPDMEQYDPFHSLYLGAPEALPPLMLSFTEKPSTS